MLPSIVCRQASMKPSEPSPAMANVVSLPQTGRRRRDELEFLPAALEIIETPASPLGRAIAGTIIGFLSVATLWASFSHIDIIATTQGRIIPTGKSKVIQPFETGVVKAIHVSDGETVKAGDILVEIDPTENAADEKRLAYDLAQDRLDIARLNGLLANDETASLAPPLSDTEANPPSLETARRQMEAQAEEHRAKLAAVDRQIAGKEAETRQSTAAIEKLQAALPLVTEQRDIRKALLANQYGSRIFYLQAEQQVVETHHGIDGEQHHLAAIREELSGLQRQRAEIDADYRKGLLADLSKAETQAAEHAQEIAKAAQKRSLRMLRAPVDGTVQQLSIHTIGGIVTPAQQLMVVVPKDSKLEIETTLANKDVGFVHKDQDVEIKIEAFTFTRYGLLHGKVTSVSQDVVAPQDNQANNRNAKDDPADPPKDDSDRQSRQPSYVAHVSIDENGIETEQGYMQLEPGMAVTAEIKTGQRTVMSYLLSPLMRYKHEGLRER